MSNLLEQGFYLGLSALSLSAEKANELAQAIVNLNPKENIDSKQMVDKLMAEGKKAQDNLQALVEKVLKSDKLSLPISKDIKDLQNRVAELEAALAALKADKPQA